jgi:hypothetical protein
LFCGSVHWVVVVEPPPPPVFEDDVVVVTLVDVVVEFELLDGDELQAARPRAKATDANPSRDRFFRLVLLRLVPLGACSCDINSICGPRSLASLGLRPKESICSRNLRPF